MKKIYSILFVLFALSFTANATHLVYEDATYKNMGGNVYQITLTIYRDCGSAAAPTSMSMNYCSPSGYTAVTGSLVLPQISGTGMAIFPVCSYASSTCIGGPNFGFQKYVYRANVTLPSACPDWTFRHEICCRQATIATIINPLSTGTAIKFVINNLDAPGNSSPTFNDEPVVFACCNQLWTYNQSATDIDGDSIVYSLYNPLSDNQTCTTSPLVVYNSAYSYTDFISSSPAISMDPSTGYLTMYPTVCSEISVMGVMVKEYRAGILIGSIMRDNTIFITNQIATDILEEQNENAFSVSPNPTSHTVMLSVNEASTLNKKELSVFNVLGKLLFKQTITKVDSEIDLSNFPKGIYLLQLSSDSGIYSERVIKE